MGTSDVSEMGNAPQQRKSISLDHPLQIALANLKHHIEHNRQHNCRVPTEVWSDRTQMAIALKTL